MGVNPGAICKSINWKGLPARKVGRLWEFKISEIDARMLAGKAGGGLKTNEG